MDDYFHDAPLPDEPPGFYEPFGEPMRPPGRKFPLERWSEIAFDGREEWLIKRLLPRVGVAAVFGKPGSFKSFVVSHLALAAALRHDWSGRRVRQCPVVYIGAEAAAGLRKRVAGFRIANPEMPADTPFWLIPAAPNLGTEKSDLDELIASIAAAGVEPGLIVLDTLAATMGSADENGAGMQSFVANAGALAQRFGALVLVVHHVGLADGTRMRGHSSLLGALDAAILCERAEGELAASLTVVKSKDDASDTRFVARLSRIVIAHDEDGDEVSTLVVDSVEESELVAKPSKAKTVPPSQRLLMSCIVDAIDEAGESFRPFGAEGPLVRGVDDTKVRSAYYARIAETPKDGDTPKKLADRQRQAFNTAIVRRQMV